MAKQEEDRELAAILITIKEEQDRLEALGTHVKDALRGLGAIAQMAVEYSSTMKARIEEAKQVEKVVKKGEKGAK